MLLSCIRTTVHVRLKFMEENTHRCWHPISLIMLLLSLSSRPQSLATLSTRKRKKFSNDLPNIKPRLQQHTHQLHQVNNVYPICQIIFSVVLKYIDLVEQANIHFQQQYCPWKCPFFYIDPPVHKRHYKQKQVKLYQFCTFY